MGALEELWDINEGLLRGLLLEFLRGFRGDLWGVLEDLEGIYGGFGGTLGQ